MSKSDCNCLYIEPIDLVYDKIPINVATCPASHHFCCCLFTLKRRRYNEPIFQTKICKANNHDCLCDAKYQFWDVKYITIVSWYDRIPKCRFGASATFKPSTHYHHTLAWKNVQAAYVLLFCKKYFTSIQKSSNNLMFAPQDIINMIALMLAGDIPD